MLRFRFLGFPVRVHWMFWVVSALLSGELVNPGRDAFVSLLVWVAVVFFSILWHELGHAQAHRRYGSSPEILLYGMGGLCSGFGRFNRHQTMWVSFAGPAASLCLFTVAYGLWKYTGLPQNSFVVRLILWDLLWVNGFWTLVNLLPVLPLDGGQIFQAFMANKKPQIVPIVGAMTAGAAAVCALVIPNPPMLFLAFFAGYLAFTNWQRGKGTHRGFW